MNKELKILLNKDYKYRIQNHILQKLIVQNYKRKKMYKIYIIYKGILNIKIERNKENIKS